MTMTTMNLFLCQNLLTIATAVFSASNNFLGSSSALFGLLLPRSSPDLAPLVPEGTVIMMPVMPFVGLSCTDTYTFAFSPSIDVDVVVEMAPSINTFSSFINSTMEYLSSHDLSSLFILEQVIALFILLAVVLLVLLVVMSVKKYLFVQSCLATFAMLEQQQRAAAAAAEAAAIKAKQVAAHKVLKIRLRKAFQQRNKLTTADKHAITQYSSNFYVHINGQIRGIKDETPEVQEIIRTLTKLLGKTTSALEVVCSKGDDIAIVYRGTVMPHRDLYDALLPGATYSDVSFLSTSHKHEVAQTFIRNLVSSSDAPEVLTVMFTIKSKTGRDISPYCGSHQYEAEVLFRPNTLFKILDVMESSDGNVHRKSVIMEEVAV